jgi:plasmid stability protein
MHPKWLRFGGKMATLTVKNLPDELYEKIKASAAANRRSINQEVIFLIERFFDADEINFETTLAEARRLREQLGIYVTDDELNQAKNEGRP